MKIDTVLKIYEDACKAAGKSKITGARAFFPVREINELISSAPSNSEFIPMTTTEPSITLPVEDVIKLCRNYIKAGQ